MTRDLPVDAARIGADIEALAAITDPGHPWTRPAFSALFLEGRAYIERRMREAGLQTRIDSTGNLIGRRSGRVSGKGVLMLGSHSDTVPERGRFSGIAGLICALEAARALADRSITLNHDLEVIDFLAKEYSAFGGSCIGSRGLAGQLPAEWLAREADGRTLAQDITKVGGNTDLYERRPDIRGFLELHMEPGTLPDSEGPDIGIVTAISGTTRIEITVRGRAGHAGATRMDARADALVAASELVLDIRQAALSLSQSPRHFTATVVQFSIEPNAADAIPSAVKLLIDIRAELREDLDVFSSFLDETVERAAEKWGVTIASPLRIVDRPPTPCDDALLSTLERSADAAGISHQRMVSGAEHDTVWMAKVAPSAMIFIARKEGRIHAADEREETDGIALGATVLFEAVQAMDKT